MRTKEAHGQHVIGRFLTTVVRKIRGIFVSEVAVLRPEVPMNRHQRRAKASIERRKKK